MPLQTRGEARTRRLEKRHPVSDTTSEHRRAQDINTFSQPDTWTAGIARRCMPMRDDRQVVFVGGLSTEAINYPFSRQKKTSAWSICLLDTPTFPLHKQDDLTPTSSPPPPFRNPFTGTYKGGRTPFTNLSTPIDVRIIHIQAGRVHVHRVSARPRPTAKAGAFGSVRHTHKGRLHTLKTTINVRSILDRVACASTAHATRSS